MRFIGILFYIGLCFLVASLARRNRRGYWGWFLLAFFLSPLIALLVLVLIGEKKARALITPPPQDAPTQPGPAAAQPPREHLYPARGSELSTGDVVIGDDGVRYAVHDFIRDGLVLRAESGEKKILEPLNPGAPRSEWVYALRRA